MSDKPKPDEEEASARPNKLTADAVAVDGMISMLQSQPGNKRKVSFASQQRLGAEMMSLQYNDIRLSLERWLTQQIELLVEMQKFSSRKEVWYPDERFKVLDMQMKVERGNHSAAYYLGQLLGQVVNHSFKLRERIENTTSHVLITGDVNAGKSSLCNALLRRPVLPVDQQPCTDVFCEVIDFQKNDGVEQVHAVYKGHKYNRDDLSTYKIFSLEALEDLVHDLDYILLKIYLEDTRDPSTAILSNGIVDICLIDAPGLNVDVATTQEVFGRQEEIDLVIFVVSAENHFTQSSKEFVSNTSREKSLVFIVVNNFDKIRDQNRCKSRILGQVKDLVPETHKGAGDFVHFVNSNDPDNSDPDNHGPDSPDFDQLEARLRNFVLEKRAISKLAPAKNYLLNVLGDVVVLAEANCARAAELDASLQGELEKLSPGLDKTISECAAVGEQIDKDIERLSHAVYTQSTDYLRKVVDSVGEQPVVEYGGVLEVFSYAQATRDSIVSRIQEAVHSCEENARNVTSSAVSAIKQLGVLHVGDQPAFQRVFQKSAMFSRKRDNLGRHIKAELSVSDFFDFGLFERQLPVLQASKSALVASAPSTLSTSLAAFSVVGTTQLVVGHPAVKALTSLSSLSTLRRLALPVALLAAAGVVALIVHELPRSVPRKMARKIALEIDELGYVGTNATRIAAECRKVLKFPAQDVRSAFQSTIETQSRQRDQVQRQLEDAHEATTFFEYVEDVATKQRAQVDACCLDLSVE